MKKMKKKTLAECTRPGELWEPVPLKGCRELYLVSNMGAVWSKLVNRLLRIQTSRNGYKYVPLLDEKGGWHYKYYVHRLVAGAFVPLGAHLKGYKISELDVNHLDENPMNNRAENLQWCTHRENIRYGNCVKKRKKTLKGNIEKGLHKSARPVMQVNPESMEAMALYPSYWEAARAVKGLAAGINNVVKRRQPTYKGYAWQGVSREDYASGVFPPVLPLVKRDKQKEHAERQKVPRGTILYDTNVK